MKRIVPLLFLGAIAWHCRDTGEPIPPAQEIASDADLYSFITNVEPYTVYALFPNADSVTAGTLNGSTAHRPMVRVSMNGTAFGALTGGRLPAGGAFPDGSVIVKEIREGSGTTVLAVMRRDRSHPASGQGWLWAEYTIGGGTLFSIQNRGSGCISCHSREQGLQNDLVRTFERQFP